MGIFEPRWEIPGPKDDFLKSNLGLILQTYSRIYFIKST